MNPKLRKLALAALVLLQVEAAAAADALDDFEIEDARAGSVPVPSASGVSLFQVRPYSGAHSAHPLLAELTDSLEARIGEATERIAAVLGEDFRLERPPVIWFHDASPRQPGCSNPGNFAEALHRRTTTLGFHVEPLVAGDADFQLELAHELVHAAMRGRMGRAAYRAVPRWLREGLALFAAGQGEERLRHLAAGYESDPEGNLVLKDAPRLVSRLETRKHDLSCYVEDVLAIQTIADEFGERAIRRLYSFLMDKVPYREALRLVTGLDWSEYADLTERRSASIVRQLLLPGRAAFGSALGVYSRARSQPAPVGRAGYRRAARMLQSYLHRHSGSAYRRQALLLLARARFRGGDAARCASEVRSALTELLASRGPYRKQARALLARLDIL